LEFAFVNFSSSSEKLLPRTLRSELSMHIKWKKIGAENVRLRISAGRKQLEDINF